MALGVGSFELGWGLAYSAGMGDYGVRDGKLFKGPEDGLGGGVLGGGLVLLF